MRAESGSFRSRMDLGTWALLFSALGLVLIGSVAILSAASPLPHYGRIIHVHFTAVAVGILAFLFGVGLNYQLFSDQHKFVYALTILVLIAVLIFGRTVRGHRSWMRLGGMNFQPTELARVTMILVLAKFLDARANKMHTLTPVLQAGALVAPILLLILKQPDFSSTVIFFLIILAMLFAAGASIHHLVSLAGYGFLTFVLPVVWTLLAFRPELVAGYPAVQFFASLSQPGPNMVIAIVGIFVLGGLLWRLFVMARAPIHWLYFMTGSLIVAGGLVSGGVVNHQIKDYQRNRVVAMVAPEADPQGASYNVNQALVAIGSGGLQGKGIFQGTQSRLGFLPERHTDFIFAVVGEEMGFWGAGLALLLYFTLIWRIVTAARVARDRYGFLVCTGIAAMFAGHLFINVGMCLGIFPVAGVPLLMLSYGGSSLVTTLWALGIVLNVHSRHYSFV
ncbi:MAG: rod shape-determining protein RodA [Elusimicrobia bacterium]|nr:rod shape-determining protein RodA [Elusimicrobiota bacterium]